MTRVANASLYTPIGMQIADVLQMGLLRFLSHSVWKTPIALIHPKLQNRHANAPDTTRQASQPPSGNDAGSKPVGASGVFSSAFSKSESGDSSAVSGRTWASVLSTSVALVGEESVEEDSFSSASEADGIDDPAIDRRGVETSSAEIPLWSCDVQGASQVNRSFGDAYQ